eukprot:g6456.t1
MDCSLCCEPFSEEGRRVPRNLDCGHTFCTECIQELDRHASLRQGPRCPECRALIKSSRRSISNLPKNYKLLELIRERSLPTTKPGADTSENYYDTTVVSESTPAPVRPQQCLRGRHVEEIGEEIPMSSAADMFFGLNYATPNGRVIPYPSQFGNWISSTTTTPTTTTMMHPNNNRHGSESRTSRRILEDRIHHYQMLPPPPPLIPSMPHDDQLTAAPVPPPPPPPPAMTLISSPLISSQTNPVLPTPTQSLVFPSAAIQETNISVHNAVETGRAVVGPNGTLVCKFYQEGTCRYGPYCWFDHPILNQNKAMCRHWKKGQCRMGLSCNYRHGTQQPVQPFRRRSRPTLPTNEQRGGGGGGGRDPSAAGPSSEGISSQNYNNNNNTHEPSVVVFVSNCGSTIHRASNVDNRIRYQRQQRNNRLMVASSSSDSSETETFFDVFGGSTTTTTVTNTTTTNTT